MTRISAFELLEIELQELQFVVDGMQDDVCRIIMSLSEVKGIKDDVCKISTKLNEVGGIKDEVGRISKKLNWIAWLLKAMRNLAALHRSTVVDDSEPQGIANNEGSALAEQQGHALWLASMPGVWSRGLLYGPDHAAGDCRWHAEKGDGNTSELSQVVGAYEICGQS